MIDVIGSHLLMFIVLKPPKPKRLDMEPPEVPFGTNLPSTFSTLRIRGGMEHEPVDKYGTTVPKLSSSNFMWDGQPSVTLMKDIIYPLYMGLGSIQDRGSSLYETVKQIDKGGVLATPSRAVCLASGNPRLIENVEESKSRNRRAFCVIMNYTRYLHPPLTEKGPYFQKSGCENRTRAQKLSTRRAPLATSFSENRTPASKNRTLPMAGSCSRPAGLVAC